MTHPAGKRKDKRGGPGAAGSGTCRCSEPWGTDPCSGSCMASGIPGSSQEKLLGESGSEGMGRGALVSALEPNTARAHPPWSFPGKKAHGGSGAGGHSSLATLHSFIHSFIHPSSRHPVMQTDRHLCPHNTNAFAHLLLCQRRNSAGGSETPPSGRRAKRAGGPHSPAWGPRLDPVPQYGVETLGGALRGLSSPNVHIRLLQNE